MKVRVVIFALIGTLVSVGTQPLAGQRVYGVYGAGAQSCGTWVAERRDLDFHGLNLSWVHGFLSGVGSVPGSITFRRVDNDAIDQWLDLYCGQHPLTDLNDAAIALVIALK